MGTEREVVASGDVAGLAKNRLKTNQTISQLQSKLTVSVVGTTQSLSISCTDSRSTAAQTSALRGRAEAGWIGRDLTGG
jgi:capsular polysaccharide biosynthesis protein